MSENIFPLVTKHFTIQPGNNEKSWEDEWVVALRDGDNKEVGRLRFEDAVLHGEMKIHVDLEKEYDKEDYAKELFYSMAKFAFQFQDVREISTVCRHEDEHRVRGLEKAGYVRRETKDGCDYYSMKKQQTSWTGFYVIIGMTAGFLMGILISNLWAGTIAGVLIGTIIGYLLDKKEHKDPAMKTGVSD